MQNGTRRPTRHRQDQRRPSQGGGRDRPSGPRGNNNGNQGGQANAKRQYERYIALARAAALTGDHVETENCYQHAEHYLRVMKAHAAGEPT